MNAQAICPKCNLVVAPHDPDKIVKPRGTYHGKCYRSLCKTVRIPALSVLVHSVLLVLLVQPVLGQSQRTEPPEFKCRPDNPPTLRCESNYTWPEIPTWRTVDAEDEREGDLEKGIVVYLTLPRGERFTVIEITVADRVYRTDPIRWKDRKLEVAHTRTPDTAVAQTEPP